MKNNTEAQVKRFLKYLIPVLGFSLIVNSPKFLELKVIYNNSTDNLEIVATTLRKDPIYVFYYIGITLFIATLIVPFATVLYFNVRTFRIIYIRRKNQNSANDNMQQTNNGEIGNQLVLRTHLTLQEEKHTSEEKLFIIFFSISLLFLICQLPRLITNLQEAVFAKEMNECKKAGYHEFPLWTYPLIHISRLFLTINSSINSAIYCLFSSKYRAQAKKSFTCWKIN